MTSFENIQIKISPREMIFENKNQQKQTKNEICPPKCFYHPQDEIIFFCKHPRCTLPLCQKCLNIHRMEHLTRKQIPMQNVISFKQSKEFVLTQLKQNKSKVKSNHKAFQIELIKYKERLFQVIEVTLDKLKDQLYLLDEQNSLFKLNQISQSIDKVSHENSLTDIIKCYEQYYQKRGESLSESKRSQVTKVEERKNSIIDHIKFVADEKQLVKVIERGFLNCKFVRQELKTETQKPTQNTKLNCQQYLLQQNDSPIKQMTIKTPINKLDQLHDTSEKKPHDCEQHVSWQHNVSTNQFPSIEAEKIIDVKRQQRRSIFKEGGDKEKENKRFVSKSMSFNNFGQKDVKKQLKREPLFSDVKKYKFEDDNQDLQLGKKSNIYTQNLKFQSYTTPAQTPFVSRTRSSSSLKNRGKGISLVKPQPLQQVDHYRQKQKQTVNKMKIRLKSEANLRDHEEISFSRQSSADWKRVVNMTDSSASSFRQSRVSNQNSNFYVVKSDPFYKTEGQQGFQYFKGIENTDVLNPMEMRQLLMKKRSNIKTIQNSHNNYV